MKTVRISRLSIKEICVQRIYFNTFSIECQSPFEKWLIDKKISNLA